MKGVAAGRPGWATYSSFSYETMRLLVENAPAAFVSVAVTLFGGLVAGWPGLLAGRAFVP